MTFKDAYNGGNCETCAWMAAQGVIVSGTAAALEAYIKKRGSCYNVRLHSPGGSIIEALKMGEIFRKYECTTEVGKTTFERYGAAPNEVTNDTAQGDCMSACALAFLGGKVRRVEKGSGYGVHQHYDPSSLNSPLAKTLTASDVSNSQLITGLLVSYASWMGVDPLLISLASSTRPTDPMYVLSDRELRQLRVVTNVMPPPGKWLLSPSGIGLAALITHDQMEDQPQSARLLCSNPSGTQKIFNLVITVPARGRDKDFYLKGITPAENALTVITADSKTIRSASYRVSFDDRSNSRSVHYAMRLSDADMQAIVRTGTFSWTIDTARAVSSLFQGQIAGSGLAVIAPFVERNCI